MIYYFYGGFKDFMAVSDRLASIRKEKKMSQLDLANKVSLHTNAIGRYERGEAIPSVDVAIKLAKALEVSLDYLTGLTNVELNDVTLSRLGEINALNNEDREHVYKVLDALLRDAKSKK